MSTMTRMTRRVFIQSAAAAAPALILARRLDGWQRPDPWQRADEIVRRIVVPKFPARAFDITKYGAVGDGKASCTGAVRKAIAACVDAGGGQVIVPAGRFLTGALRLQSNVNLHLDDKATLAFTDDVKEYPIVFTRWEGVELMNLSPFIYAFKAQDVAITGGGTLDGQADEQHWWPWRLAGQGNPGRDRAARTRLIEMQAKGVPVAERVFGAQDYLRPNFIQPYRSRNILIDGITIINSPMWEIHPVLCESITVKNVTIRSHGPNNDGCDPESCKDVLIDGCTFDTGDDCIALKSGRNDDGRRINVPVENVVIRNCRMKAGHGGITIGSEITGGARNVYAERCTLDSPDLERGLRLKTNTMRGGVIENVFVRDIEIGNVKLAPIEIDLRYGPPESGPFLPIVRNVQVERMHSTSSKHGLYIHGLENAPVRDVVVRDSTFRGVAEGHVIEGAVNVKLEGLIVEKEEKQEKR